MNQYTLPQVWEGVKSQVGYAAKQREVEEFNRSHAWVKRGVAVTPTRWVGPGSRARIGLKALPLPTTFPVYAMKIFVFVFNVYH